MLEDDAQNPPPPASREPSSKDVAGEDFLFHLYRGSELLQDNNVHEAKQELEHALSLQPRDAKGQDLLAIVYFRLGLYPRAISIYESLIQLHAHAATPRINLALCYLKTGQAAAARSELERVLELNPEHSRAWGYLGLAFQRLGDYERAFHAFLAGGHEAMAKRVADMAGLSPEAVAPDRSLVGRAASAAYDELSRPATDARHDEPFRTDSEAHGGRAPSGTWSAVEPGREPPREGRRGSTLSPSIVPSLAPSESLLPPLLPREEPRPPSDPPPLPRPPAAARFDADIDPPSVRPRSRAPSVAPRIAPAAAHLTIGEAPEAFARRLLLVFPRHHTAALHPSGLALLQSTGKVAARIDMVRALTYPLGFTSTILNRRARGRDLEEPLGGTASPLFEIEGSGSLVIGPSVGARLSLVAVGSEPLFVRESALVAMESSVAYENGRLAGGDGDAIAIVQLRSEAPEEPLETGGPASRAGERSASVVLALPPSVSSVEVSEGHSLLLRAHSILGWTGRVIPRGLAPSEAPGKMRGFVSLLGQGMVFVDAR